MVKVGDSDFLHFFEDGTENESMIKDFPTFTKSLLENLNFNYCHFY